MELRIMSRAFLPFIVLVTVLAGAFLSPADEPNLKTVSTDDLIVRLGRAEFAEREQASKALKHAAHPCCRLRKAVKHRDAEVRRRAEELIPVLEHIAAVAPKCITLSTRKQPLSVILKEIEKQTGYTVKEEERNDYQHYSFEMKNVPFWEAIEQIRREAKCLVVTDTGVARDIDLQRRFSVCRRL